MTQHVTVPHANYFNTFTVITTVDSNTVVVPAKDGYQIFITDLIIVTTQAAAIGSFTITDDDGTALLGPIPLISNTPFIAHFQTPLVNETQNNQVEMDKTAAEDDWKIWVAGYYKPST
jgi:hypothetical protein